MAAFALPVGQENTWLGSFGESWFRTVCNVAACPVSKMDPDVVGVDFVVHNHHHATIRVQVKTTANPNVGSGAFKFELDVNTYDRLRSGQTKGYLALVVVGAAHPKWTRHFKRKTEVATGIYWVCLEREPATKNKSVVTLTLPFANMLTPKKLLSLFP